MESSSRQPLVRSGPLSSRWPSSGPATTVMHLLGDDPECLARGYYSRQRNHRRSKLGSLPPMFRIAWCCTVDLVYLQSTRGPNSTPVGWVIPVSVLALRMGFLVEARSSALNLGLGPDLRLWLSYN
ncbi:hypothetical protein RHGRI_037132 [Rhododendron griersonianum]|uniref:Uncharacterized protein n=1 Tax=Rhododendron griersonianum TaxID=479676 RepID=A0AAV6HRP0_9ERIC|nr:hypothetical protein RHGRI_037132 [Rhododendron griersonianum]